MYRQNKIIDAHQHYWQISRGDYGWLTPELKLLYRDYMPGDLASLLHKHGVTGTIAVQAASTVAETEFLLALSERHKELLGVVGWIDLDSDDIMETIRRLNRHSKLVGIRPMLQKLLETDGILSSRVIRHLQLLAEAGISLDVVVESEQLPCIVSMLIKVPKLRIVLNHLGSPDVKRPEAFADWAECISAISCHPKAMCKISGMITLADGYDPARLKPYVNHVLHAFGTHRAMFGSDWPVALLAGGYDEVIRLFWNSLPEGLSQDDVDRITWRNAEHFYRIEERLALMDKGEA
ncbi:amidohydrolase family protein [Cohnella abietis]|uniref:Hydrolase n=1 Tax=Cohnella abietis TaxID=2507935 RepID=A0A3T1D407_9BACL|nr:amidohydrolase family protein [Cohnella abietis]BBI32715.1 hydrolase [Cohnella abietis]